MLKGTTIFALVWFLVPFPAMLITDLSMRKRWVLEDSAHYYGALAAATVIAAIVWLVGLGLAMPDIDMDNQWKGLLIAAAFVSLIGGDFFLLAGSVFGDNSAGEFVQVRAAQFVGVNVRFEVTTGLQRGLILSCGKQTWGPATGGERTFILHRGRLGLWWGEFAIS
jgi:hypothetical protein